MLEDIKQLRLSLRKDSPVPLYHQVEEILYRWITERMSPGELLPSEKELCDIFQVSRSVIRQALGNLVNRGIIERQRGKGTIVVRPKINEYLMSKLTGFYSDMKSQGLTPVTKLLSKETVEAYDILAYYLDLRVGDKVIKIERLRYVEEEPILVVTSYIPYDLCPGLLEEDLENNSLYEILENKYNINLTWGERSIEAIPADSQDAKLLRVKKGSPLLFLRSITYTENNKPIEYYEAKHRADRARFITWLFKIPVSNEMISKTLNTKPRLSNFSRKTMNLSPEGGGKK